MSKEEFNPMHAENPRAVVGGNLPPRTKEDVFKDIISMWEETAVWADGQDIENQAQHDAVTSIREAMHDLGKEAEAMRVAEKKPFDEKIDAIQKEFNPYVQKAKGKVDKAKAALDVALGKWRIKEQKRKAEIAAQQAAEAEEERRKATAAIRESSGNLLAREEAEQMLERAKETESFARRAEKDANTSTGLRTVRSIELPEDSRADGMDWAFENNTEAFYRLAVDLAAQHYSATKRVPPGFVLNEKKVAR